MRALFIVFFLLSVVQLSAQKECGTQQYIASIKNAASSLKGIAEAENFIQKRLARAGTSSGKLSAEYIVRIPVVVHVVYYQSSQNISEAHIKAQIDILNRDFRKRNADTASTPQYFKSLAADAQIEFVLATADPNGRATNGIVRKKTTVQYWQMDDKIKYSAQGGDDAWDSRSYLNIWVGDMKSLLGYASIAGGPADKDGVVINFSAFGNTGGEYNMGRTAVHEVGHWLGLRHIWGDTYCGDDGIDDTPKQGGFTSGCPSGMRVTCSNGSTGDMYMNYMDFTNDACMNMFTRGQKERMRLMFEDGAPKASLLSSKGLNEPWAIEEIPMEETPVTTAATAVKVYPNPAVNETILDFEYDLSWIGNQINLVNINGVALQKINITSRLQKVYLSQLTHGIYFIQGVNRNNGKRLNQKIIKL